MSSRLLFLLVLGLILAFGAVCAWWLARAVARRIRGWMPDAPMDAAQGSSVARFTQCGVFTVQFAAYAYAAYLLAPLLTQVVDALAR